MHQIHNGWRRSDSQRDAPVTMATMPASGRQRKIALGVYIVLVVLLAATLPFASIKLPRVDAFVPVIQTVMCLADLITAVLLFAQYSVYPQRAVLVLGGGYVFSGLFAFLQTLAFPGAYAPLGLIGDTLNSPGWLFVFWHTTFSLAVIVYALLKDADDPVEQSRPSTGVAIAMTLACVAAATAALTWLATTGAAYLPAIYASVSLQTPVAVYADIFLTFLGVTTFAVLFARRRTILDHWLLVTLLAWLPNFFVGVLFTIIRFTVGWYAARVYALCAGSSLLIALLAETTVLYARAVQQQRRLSTTVGALKRSNRSLERLNSELDHRVKNLLARVAVIAKNIRQGNRSIDDLVQALDRRIQSMADAHTLLSQSRWHGVNIAELVRQQLAPYASDTNTVIGGPDMTLSATATQAVAMVLQELATNAVKYGALSTPKGQVQVHWDRRTGTDGAARVAIAWREIDGPSPAASHQSSYGTNLIRNLIPHELGGTVDLVFAPEGVRCNMEIPDVDIVFSREPAARTYQS
jgi:two-component sensor histidine kinase